MSSTLAVITRDPNLMRCELLRLRTKVRLSADGPIEAAGLGYVLGTEVLLRKKPGISAAADLYDLGKGIEADAVVCAVRSEKAGAFKDETTQPFRYRRWLFAHDGAIEAAEQVRPALLGDLPDHLRRHLKGATDSELAFMHFLKRLPAGARDGDADVSAKDAARALGEAARGVDGAALKAGAHRTSALNFVATNGRILTAVRLGGAPLFYAPFEGISTCEACGINETSPDTNPLVRAHRMLRSVAVTNHRAGANTWIDVPEAHGLAVGRNLDLHVVTI